MKSAIRRHHYKRVQKARSRYWSGHEIKHSPRESGMIVATPHPCSCLGCGNLRKHLNQKSIQERRNFQPDGLVENRGVNVGATAESL